MLTKAILHVHSRGSTLEDTECLDDGRRHTVLGLVDLEVAQGTTFASVSDVPLFFNVFWDELSSSNIPLGLGTPVLVRRDLYGSLLADIRTCELDEMETNLDLTESIGLSSSFLGLFGNILVSQLPRISFDSSGADIRPRLLLCISISCVPF